MYEHCLLLANKNVDILHALCSEVGLHTNDQEVTKLKHCHISNIIT